VQRLAGIVSRNRDGDIRRRTSPIMGLTPQSQIWLRGWSELIR
jgi:hypothetical protein